MRTWLLSVFMVFFVQGLIAQTLLPNAISSAVISPNPVEDKAELAFEVPVTENLTVVVKDLTGKTVYSIRPEITGNDCTSFPLEIESLRKGIYICQITGSSGKVKTLKFQKN